MVTIGLNVQLLQILLGKMRHELPKGSISGTIMKNFLILCMFVMSTTAASAHSKVNKMTPENGSVVETIPQSLEFSFGKSIRLTKVEMIYGETAQQLGLDGQTSFSKEFSIPFAGKENGIYQINWRGLSKDGHAMKGDFSFEVK